MENRIDHAAASRPERDTGTSPTDATPPIPDGGLGATMPEWLLRPPAWRGMTVREPQRRELPPPDTSVIDPRTMLQIDDLPEWLQRIAARSADAETETVEVTERNSTIALHGESHAGAGALDEPDKPPVVERSTCVPMASSRSTQAQPRPIVFLPAPASPPSTLWRSSLVVVSLALVILLIVIWQILVAR